MLRATPLSNAPKTKMPRCDYLIRPGRWTKYCDERVCMYRPICLFVCLSVCSHISKTIRWTCPKFTKFSVHVRPTCGRGSVLLWRQCNCLCGWRHVFVMVRRQWSSTSDIDSLAAGTLEDDLISWLGGRRYYGSGMKSAVSDRRLLWIIVNRS